MKEKIFEFGLGDEKLKLALPEQQIIHEIEGRPYAPVSDVAAAVKEALHNPIGTPPLPEVVKPGDKVAIIVSDITRAWIKFDHFLPVLLDELNAAGIPDSDMFIVIGLGAHRAHIADEDVLVCGQNVCHRVPIYQHDCHDQENLVYTGTTSRGVKCYINRRVAEADKVILTGGIVYHLMSGFGAGRKAIMPGVSAFTSIQGNHLYCMNKEIGKGLNPNSTSGKLEGNEMHEDMSEVAALANPDFLLNAVFTPEGKFAKFFAGHWYKAWEAGTKLVEQIYGIPIKAKADLVIASAGGFPKDINLYQGAKTIDNAYLAVKPGGVIICFLECRDIYEPPEFSGWFKHKDMLELELAVRNHFTVPGFVACKISLIARENTLIFVTKPENADFIRSIGMIPVTTAEEAYAIAKEKLGRDDYTITVMPHAANTVPLLQG
ncbi:MAG: nickel-dependent lactate racemase [Negativicutes bacterium]|nr:nickel-dependent lactate racemase [Negativicutes bacterium]